MAWGFVLDLLVASNMGMAIQHLGPWATCSSLCFFIGALCGGDVLALRGALMLAYVFNLINGLAGVPAFPYYNVEGRLNVDMVFWAVASGFLHGCSVARMLLDELPVRFASGDDEQLARFLNRRSGMERLEARETLKRGKWMRVAAGERIVSSVELHEQVYLLVEGSTAAANAAAADVEPPHGLVEPPAGSPPVLLSGHVFSLSALNVFGVYIGFDQDHGRHLEVWAESDCLLYSWPMSALEQCANYSPALASYWRSFALYSVAAEFEHRAHKGTARCSTGEYEQEGWLAGGRSRDFTDDLRPYEQPAKPSWAGVKRWLKKAVSPFPPHGIRHTALPTTGVMARTRAMAIADARKQAEEAALARQAELEEIAACSVCSADLSSMMLTPRTAAALRHERERAWLQAWSDTAAVHNTSIWLGLPQGCAPDQIGLAAAMLQQQQQQQQQQGGGAGRPGYALAPPSQTSRIGMPPFGAASPEMWQQQQQQQQQVWQQQPQLRGRQYKCTSQCAAAGCSAA
ncbi:hypothetical protein OEZ85_014226 [Tetradesmus obliquus]|uniref:Cyclic nucleotide-binding domain-containing protein n=1 Tax=Tetradesmus obliquus TaxID=3088 RepID=A0ABY8U7C7_TETOB|nr:hypothetical protein OEZ85_014226 [Tetradesmus obliquus]